MYPSYIINAKLAQVLSACNLQRIKINNILCQVFHNYPWLASNITSILACFGGTQSLKDHIINIPIDWTHDPPSPSLFSVNDAMNPMMSG